MRNFLGYAAAVAMVMFAVSADAGAAATKKKKSSHAKTTATKSAGRSKTGKKGAPVKKTTWRNRQLSPTPDRYKAIQQALVAKGFLNPDEASGAWGPASVDALKKFQSAQKLEPNGKINSLSLIALGLGPHHETTTPTEAPQF
jgi:hypothetical protein